jgi:hypothetical protein
MIRSRRAAFGIALAALVSSLGGCGPSGTPSGIASRVARDAVAIEAAEGAIVGEVRVYSGGAATPTATARLGVQATEMSRLRLRRAIEVHRLPADFERIALATRGGEVDLFDRRRPPPEPGAVPPYPLRYLGFTVFFALLAFYCVSSVGISGGPNHGEHPFIVNLLHALVFLALAAWEGAPYWGYLGLLAAALVLSCYVMPLRVWNEGEARRVWLARAAMLAIYAGLYAILASEPDYAPAAHWAGPRTIAVDVGARRRGSLELLGEGGAVLAAERLDPGPAARIVVLWPEAATPRAVRLTGPDTEAREVAIERSRPGAR